LKICRVSNRGRRSPPMLYSSSAHAQREPQESLFAIGGMDPSRNSRVSNSSMMHSRSNFSFHPNQNTLQAHHPQHLGNQSGGIKSEPGTDVTLDGGNRGHSTSAQSQSALWPNNFASLSLTSQNTTMTTSPANSTNSSSGSSGSANSGSYSPSSYLYPYAGAMWRHHYDAGISRTHHPYGKFTRQGSKAAKIYTKLKARISLKSKTGGLGIG